MRIGLRGSPSWPGEALRPDTLKQTDQSQMKITLADGAGHTFFGLGYLFLQIITAYFLAQKQIDRNMLSLQGTTKQHVF